MPQKPPLLQAIDDLRPELPKLAGARWPAFSADLARLENDIAGDEVEPRLARAAVLNLFAQAPPAQRRLLPLLETLESGYVPALVRDLPRQPFALLAAATRVAEVRRLARHGQAIIVTGDDGRPVGVLTEEDAPYLDDPDAALDRYAAHFQVPVLTTFETPLAAIGRGIRYERSIRWHVILRGSQIKGLVAPQDLFHTVPQMPGDEELEAVDVKGLFRGLAGDPVAPPSGLCYRCKSDSSHHVTPGEVRRRDVVGNALCEIDHSVMIAENPCRTGV